MPRSYQAYPQNAVVTHSPSNVGTGDTSSAIDQGNSLFKLPPGFDVCAPVTQNGQNPFMAGLNTMGDGENHTGVAGQTGNILSGFQQFSDSLCGFLTGGSTVSEVLEAARNLRRRGGNLHETIEAVRRLRDTVGTGTTPQSVLAGVEGVSGAANANPLISDAITKGKTTSGATGNQALDGLNGASSYAGTGHQLLAGTTKTNTGINDLLGAGGNAINQNTANHIGHQSLTPATAVSLKDQGLLVANDFSASYMVAADPSGHWTWDGTDGAPSTGTMGCLKATANGHLLEYVSSEVPVVPAERIELSCQVKTVGLTYTGTNPITLCVEKYRRSKDSSGNVIFSDVGGYDVLQIAPGTTADWKGFAGTYTVPTSGVDQIRLKLKVTATATSGVVKFDDCDTLKLDLISDAAVPGLGLTTDAIVTQLYGSAGAGFTHNDAANALGNTANTLTSVASRVAALEAEGFTGAIAGDDFSWSGEVTASPNWGGGYSTVNPFIGPVGYYTANGVDAVWQRGNRPQTCWFDWQGTDAVSHTDYQLVQGVLDSAPTSATVLFSSVTVYSSIRLFGRVAADWSSYVMADISSAGTYAISYFSGGSLSTIGSGTAAVPGLASVISFYCGDKTSSLRRRFRLEVGTQIIAEVDDPSTGSPLGASNRRWGWGASAGFTVGAAAIPPKLNQWLGMDQ